MLATSSPAKLDGSGLDYHSTAHHNNTNKADDDTTANKEIESTIDPQQAHSASISPRKRHSSLSAAGPLPVSQHYKTKIAILDAGAQYGKVIDRRLRELNIYCELLPLSVSSNELYGYTGIIISGGPQSVYGVNAPKYDPKLFTDHAGRVPILGICYGM
jgi:carbamoylphosphate synthase small subunit